MHKDEKELQKIKNDGPMKNHKRFELFELFWVSLHFSNILHFSWGFALFAVD